MLPSDVNSPNSSDPQALLRLAQQRFANLIRSLPLGIVICGRNGLIEAVNPTIVSLFGHDERELARKPLEILIGKPWSGAEDFESWCTNNLEKTTELEGRALDGERFPIDITPSLLDTDSRGRLIILIQDVTQRFLAEQFKTEFYQMINHDVRSPLSSLSAFLDTMLTSDRYGSLNESGRERLLLAHNNVNYIVNLVSNLLELDRLESDRQYLKKAQTQAAAFINEAINTVREIADTKQLTIDTDIEDITLDVDHPRLVQVMVNLLSNAITHSPSGTTVSIKAWAHGKALRLTVIDQGPGIPAEVIPVIFERYRRAQTKSAGGFGLGLAICRQIIKEHGGTIGCQNVSDRGACFWLEIPQSGIFI